MSALDAPRRWAPASVPTQVAVLTGRALREGFADRRVLFFALVQPVVLLVVFSQVFAAAGRLPAVAIHGGYVGFLVPATLVNVALTTAMSSGAQALEEIHGGLLERLRTLPMRLSTLLVARNLADTARTTVQLVVVVVAAALALGYRPAGGPVGVLAAVALAVLVGAALGWLFLAIACWATRPATVQAVSSAALFPLLFGSSAFMPRDSMPAWLAVVSGLNPLTHAIDAARDLAAGLPAPSLPAGVIGSLLVAAVAAPVAVRHLHRSAR